MGFLNPCHKCEEEVQWLRHLVDVQAQTILNLSKPKPANPVHLEIIFNNNKNSNKMSLEIQANQLSVGTLSLVDSTTNAPVAATFSNTTAVSDTPGVAAAVVNADGTVTISGVSAGTANVTITSTASFTNSLGVATTGNVTSVVAVTIDAVPVADGVTLVISFSPAAPQS